MPIVGVDEPEIDQENFRQIRGVRCDGTEVGATIFESPPARVRHAGEFDLRGKHAEGMGAARVIDVGQAAVERLQRCIDIHAVPVEATLTVLLGDQHLLRWARAFRGGTLELILELICAPGGLCRLRNQLLEP